MEEMIAVFFVDSKQKDSRDVRLHNNDAKILGQVMTFLYHTRSNRPYSLCIEDTMRVASHIYTRMRGCL
jgi:hypothetical protein